VGAAERIDLLAPQTPEGFAAWRSRSLERASQERLAQKVEEAARKGKKAPSSLGKADQEKVANAFPSSWFDAVGWDTSRLQRGGWDMPPGARWAAYRRPREAARVNLETHVPSGPKESVDTALLALSSDARRSDLLPPLRDAVRRTQMLHHALATLADPAKTGRNTAALTGRLNGVPLRGHRHAQLIPLSLSCRADRFDHILVYAAMGLDDVAREALGAVRKTYAKGIPELFVTLAGLGSRDDFLNRVPHLKSALVWRSCSPFVPPRFMKRRGRNSLRGQIEQELGERGLPEPVGIRLEIEDRRFVPLEQLEPGMRPTSRFRRFHLERGDASPPMRTAFSLELRFAQPARGPIALGYACHFGLGVFAPFG
jgi:CRISPR-associated protein Csb2